MFNRSDLKFQRCTISHLTTLAEISKRTFIEAFAAQNNPNDFKNYIETAFSEKKLKKELLNSDSFFYLVYLAGSLSGYFKLNVNAAQAENRNKNAMELERIYVVQEFQGKRIGSAILNKTIEIATLEKKDFIWLGVWQKNTSAIKFYEDHGFKKTGTHPYFIGNDEQTDWLMEYSMLN